VIDATVNCSVYSSEFDIVNLNPFFVRLDLSSNLTSVEYDSKLQQMKKLIIVNDRNPSINVFCLKNLQSLQLINTNLSLLPDIINLKNLTFLQIESDNGIIGDYLPAEIVQLTYLSSLILIKITNLTSLPDEIGQLNRLQSLTLAQLFNLQNIPSISMGKLTELRILNFTDVPKLSSLPSPMENFLQLNTFVLTNTNLSNLILQNLQELTILLISSNLAMISIQIDNMIKLSSLEITGNNALLTINLASLISLETFTVNSNKQLSSISMENIPLIESLSINYAESLKAMTFKNLNSLNAFNSTSYYALEFVSFENTPWLTVINLSGNSRFQTVSFTNAPRMKQLDLSSCQFTSFPSSILTLTSLEILNMQSNQLSLLPPTLSTDLPNLKVLNLANNRFQGNIIQPPLLYIRELDMSRNSLTTLDSISEYGLLERLLLDGNQIKSISLDIMKISPILQFLSIQANQLSSIPYSMVNMRSLKYFYVRGNQINFKEQGYLVKLFKPTPIQLYV
jgi:leucine-rich repeat protein SHOC2